MEFDLAIKAGANFTYAGDMNATKRSAHEMQWAIATGMKSGEADMRVYLPGGKLIMIELKVKGKGSVSKAQRERHALLSDLGFDVRVWRYKTPTEAAQAAREFISELRENYEV